MYWSNIHEREISKDTSIGMIKKEEYSLKIDMKTIKPTSCFNGRKIMMSLQVFYILFKLL